MDCGSPVCSPYARPHLRFAQRGLRRQGTLERDRRSDSVRRPGKGNEKAVALVVDFAAVVLLDHHAH
jgi:hypothetical protein